MVRNSWSSVSNIIIGGSASGKTNALLNLTNNDLYIDKTYLYAKDQYESKYQLLINKRVNAGLMYFNDSKAFIEFSNDMDDTYKNFEEYSPNKKRNLIVTELFIRWRKLKYFSCFYYTILLCCSEMY